jgi:hypothetical protein
MGWKSAEFREGQATNKQAQTGAREARAKQNTASGISGYNFADCACFRDTDCNMI